MMSVRRWASAGAVGVLGLGLGLQPAPAGAAVGFAELAAWDTASVSNGCANTVAGTEPGEVSLRPDGVWRTVRLSRTGMLASSRIVATSEVTGRVASNTWGTARVGLRIATKVTAAPNGPTPCAVHYYKVDARAAAGDVTATRKSWLVVRSTASSRGVFSSVLGAERTDGTEFYVAPGRSLTRLVAPGTYAIGALTTSQISVPAQSTTAKLSSSTVSATVTLFPVGTRRTLTGGARGFVTAKHRSCTYDSVRIPFTDRARTGARSIAFFVNGDHRVTLKGRGLQRSSLLLKRIGPRSAGAIKAVVVTKSGERRVMKSTSWPCR